MYWPGLNEQLEQLILNCQLCLKYSHLNASNHHICHWDRRYPSIHGQNWPLIYFTMKGNPTCCCRLHKSISDCMQAEFYDSPACHKSLQTHLFRVYGWPDTLVSDNGPCYASEVFTKIIQEYNVNHLNKLIPLPTVQWFGRKIHADCKELVPQSWRRRCRST